MSQYVTLTLNAHVYDQIIEALMAYCSNLDDFWDMQDAVHVIDTLEELYHEDMVKQNKENQQWKEYDELFYEYFEGENLGIDEYINFNKVNKVLEDYKEGGTLDILDSKQQVFLVLDLLNAMNEESV